MQNTINNKLKYGDNPRQITKEQFKMLCDNLKHLGDLSGIIYCRKNKAYTGGNMRSEVMNGCEIEIVEEYDNPTDSKTVAYGFVHFNNEKFAYREVEFTKEEFQKACIVANSNGGSWDYDVLSGWDDLPLADWGLNVPELIEPPDLDEFFTEQLEEKENKNKIVLEYSDEEFELVKTELLKHGKTYEAAVWELLGL